jgi:hypothetical protein
MFHERRYAERHATPRWAAYYWNGSNAEPHNIRDISTSGIYLLTRERWLPGTLVMITLQKPVADAEAGSAQSIRVQSKVVRSDKDGVALTFVFPKSGDIYQGTGQTYGADRTALQQFAKFL